MKSDAAHSYWVHDLSPFLVRFSDSFGIRYYGLAYVLGFLIAALLLHLYWRAGRSALDPKAQSDLLVAVVIGVMLGGRLGYFLLYSPATLLQEPLAVLRIWDGGMSSHGGFIGVCLAMPWVVRKHKLAWRSTADILVTLAPPGLFFGRIANFINGELWGKIAYVPWAIIFPKSAPDGTLATAIPPRHPSQLYEALLEGLFLTIYTQLRFWRSSVTRERPGQLAGEFLFLYAAVRAVGEVFREPDASLLFGLSRGTFYSSFLVLGGLILFSMSRRKPRCSTEELKN
jgi:phosphatidylglycerol:prolipoprotein diacylglycerol transferase